MDMNKINAQKTGLDYGKKGVEYGLNALLTQGKDMAELYSLPMRFFLGNVRCAGGKYDFMAGFDNEWIKLLTMFFNSAGNVGDTTGSSNKNFHDVSLVEGDEKKCQAAVGYELHSNVIKLSGLLLLLVPMRAPHGNPLWPASQAVINPCDAQESSWMRRIPNCVPMRRMGTRWQHWPAF
jgi:hypothetical protein